MMSKIIRLMSLLFLIPGLSITVICNRQKRDALHLWDPLVNPMLNISHHSFFIQVIEKIMKVAFI
jgi:hypothetical protein